jgi:nicotinamidase-related amidase
VRPVTGVEQIFPAVDELIAELRAAGAPRLATVFHHRMHRVAWATRSELFEELQEVLTGALNSKEEPLRDVSRFPWKLAEWRNAPADRLMMLLPHAA